VHTPTHYYRQYCTRYSIDLYRRSGLLLDSVHLRGLLRPTGSVDTSSTTLWTSPIPDKADGTRWRVAVRPRSLCSRGPTPPHPNPSDYTFPQASLITLRCAHLDGSGRLDNRAVGLWYAATGAVMVHRGIAADY
jgi:hypothetical protein